MTSCVLYKPLEPVFLRGCLASVRPVVDCDRSPRWEVVLGTHRATATRTNCDCFSARPSLHGARPLLRILPPPGTRMLLWGTARPGRGRSVPWAWAARGPGVDGAWAEALLSFIVH